MPVEFLGIGATNDGTETHVRSGPAFDPEYTVALAKAHEDNGWDRVLTAYGSGSADPAQAAALIACRTERLQLLLAHRPNVAYPTFTAKTVATLDQISGGRLTLHVITGGAHAARPRLALAGVGGGDDWSIVRGTVAANGGTVHRRRLPGVGCVVTIDLPGHGDDEPCCDGESATTGK